jgi:hypothetical protein
LQNKKFTSWTPPKVFLLLLFSSFPEKERKNEKLLNIKVQYTPVAGKKVLRAHGYAQYGSFLCVCTRRKYFHGCDPNHTFSHSLTVHILNARFSHIFPEWHYPENFLSLRSRKNSTNTDTKILKFSSINVRCIRKRKSRRWQKSPYLPHRKFSQPTAIARDVVRRRQRAFFLLTQGMSAKIYMHMNLNNLPL